jgi:virginiamycin B lyase
VVLALGLVWAPGASAIHVTVFTNHVTPGSFPRAITVGPDKKLWFTEDTGRIGRVNPATGHIDEFSAGLAPGTALDGIAPGSDGALWAAEPTRPGFARITTAGAITQIPPMPASRTPGSVVEGPDGNLWFTDGDRIGRLDPHARHIVEWNVTAGRGPEEIAVGPDHKLWFTDGDVPRIGRITTTGHLNEFPAGPLSTSTSLGAIKLGSDGRLWFVEPMNNTIGRITVGGTIKEFSAGLAPSSEGPEGLARGPDGNMWFGEGDQGVSLGRITPSGAIVEFPNGLNNANTKPGDGFTTGPDGNVWFTVNGIGPGGVDGVARMTLELPPRAATHGAQNVKRSSATLTGRVDPLGAKATVHFDWGRTILYGHHTADRIVPAGGKAVDVKSGVGGLSANTTYHYRVTAKNAFGAVAGTDHTFKTKP